jgi:hypothetical protein
LSFQAHITDFIEEEGSTVGSLEGATLFGGLIEASGACTVTVAEELGLNEVFGNGGAVEFDEHAVAALRLRVHGAGDEFFASARLAEDEDAAVGGGHEFDLLAQGFDGDGLTGDGAFGELAGELLVVFAEVVCLDRVAKNEEGAVHGERFFEEVVGTELGGSDGSLYGRVAGDHDDFRSAGSRGVGEVSSDGGEDVEAVGFTAGATRVGEPDVEDDGLVVGVAKELEGFGGGASGGDHVVFLAEDGFEGLSDIGFVVDDENVVHKGRQ